MADEKNKDVTHHDGRKVALHCCFVVAVVVVVSTVADVAVAVGESAFGQSQGRFTGSTDDSCGNWQRRTVDSWDVAVAADVVVQVDAVGRANRFW